jgi:hypothetical protein
MTRQEAKDFIKKTDDIELLRWIIEDNAVFLNWIYISKQIQKSHDKKEDCFYYNRR